MTALSESVLRQLRPLETRLKTAVRKGQVDLAIEIAGEIQSLFTDRGHHRLLKSKLWVFEAAIDANRLPYAESGLQGIRQRSNAGTRIQLEANALLGVCTLRQGNSADAKQFFREVIHGINAIESDDRRRQFQKRLMERIEEECIFSELIGRGEARLDVNEIHDQAVLLVRSNSDDEILCLIGNSIPASGVHLLKEVRNYSVNLLPAPDRKLLPAPENSIKPITIGNRAAAVLKRIAWKSLCDPDSELYKVWSKQVPEVFNKSYFASALAVSLGSWRIGLPMLGAGIAAIAMRSSAAVFCESAQPKGLMIDRTEKDE